MLVTRKLALVAVALLVAGCSAAPTAYDAATASARHETSVAAPDTAAAETTSTSSETGNLFGSGT